MRININSLFNLLKGLNYVNYVLSLLHKNPQVTFKEKNELKIINF